MAEEGAPNAIYVFDYDASRVKEHAAADINECVPYRHTDSVTWINIDKVPPLSFLEQMRLGFELHPVIEEDILTLNQRPKVEVLDTYAFVRLKTVRFDKEAKKVRHEQVSLVLAPRFVLTFQQGVVGDPFEHVRELIRKGDSRIRSHGTDYLCYELIDSMIGGFFDILDHCSTRIDQLEQDILRDPHPRSLHALNTLKREMLGLRRAAWPVREVITALERTNSPLIHESTKIYLRDVFTKLIQVTESLEIYREMISSLQDFYHLRVNSRTNEVMKFLTVIATLFMPLSFLVGFYGMNFSHLPGIESPWGPFFMVMATLAVTAGLLTFFVRKKWL